MSSRTKSKSSKKAPGKKGKGLGKLLNRIGMVLVLAFLAFCLVVIFTTPPSSKPAASKLPQRVGEPWEYDERFDTFWDPRPGHEHWHEGKPPDPADR